MKTSIEPIRELRQIPARIFGEIKRMIGSGQSRLQISQNRVDPVELGKILGFSATRFFREVESQHRKGGKAGQTIRMTVLPGARKACPQDSRASCVNPDTGESLAYIGCPSSLVDTAATKGILFSEPRLLFPPVCSPPR